MTTRDTAARQSRSRWRWQELAPYVLVAPAFLLVFGLLLYPVVNSVGLSFSNYMLFGNTPFKWVGFANYAKLLTPGSEFWRAVGVTLRYAVADIACELVIGLALALLLNREFRGRRWLRVAILIPMMVPSLSSGLIWRYMYDDMFGIIPYAIRLLGLSPPVFLADSRVTLYALVATQVWRSSPFMILVLLAALQAVSSELQEAARVDGANRLRVFFHITLPGITPAILVALLFRTVDALRTFDLVYMLTGGGPGASTEVISLYIYNRGFRTFKFGLTSAASVLLLIATVALCAIYLRSLVKRQEEALGE